MKLEELLTWAADQFEHANLYYGHGTDNSWDESVAIIRYVLKLPVDVQRDVLTKELTKKEWLVITDLVKRRIDEKIPVAYLINEALFAGLSFYVDQRIIIPRSPLAELIEQQFSPWIKTEKVLRILDLCTGGGCIAIACAHYFPQAIVDAVDISSEALAVAEINVVKHNLAGRVNLCHGDLFSPIDKTKYNIIVSNPPYIKEQAFAEFPQEYMYEPKLAFTAGDDGLHIVDQILQQAKGHLHEDGILIVEVGDCAAELQKKYPDLPFIWLEFARGGEGVFLLQAGDLEVRRV